MHRVDRTPLARAQQTRRVRIARDLVTQIAAPRPAIRELEREIAGLVDRLRHNLWPRRGVAR